MEPRRCGGWRSCQYHRQVARRTALLSPQVHDAEARLHQEGVVANANASNGVRLGFGTTSTSPTSRSGTASSSQEPAQRAAPRPKANGSPPSTIRGTTIASAEVTTTTGQASPNSGSPIRISWAEVSGAPNYTVYGRTAGSELLMATVTTATRTATDGVMQAAASRTVTDAPVRLPSGAGSSAELTSATRRSAAPTWAASCISSAPASTVRLLRADHQRSELCAGAVKQHSR